MAGAADGHVLPTDIVEAMWLRQHSSFPSLSEPEWLERYQPPCLLVGQVIEPVVEAEMAETPACCSFNLIVEAM